MERSDLSPLGQSLENFMWAQPNLNTSVMAPNSQRVESTQSAGNIAKLSHHQSNNTGSQPPALSKHKRSIGATQMPSLDNYAEAKPPPHLRAKSNRTANVSDSVAVLSLESGQPQYHANLGDSLKSMLQDPGTRSGTPFKPQAVTTTSGLPEVELPVAREAGSKTHLPVQQTPELRQPSHLPPHLRAQQNAARKVIAIPAGRDMAYGANSFGHRGLEHQSNNLEAGQSQKPIANSQNRPRERGLANTDRDPVRRGEGPPGSAAQPPQVQGLPFESSAEPSKPAAADGNDGSGSSLIECDFSDCGQKRRTRKEMRKHKKAEHDYCKLCDLNFKDWDEYHAHKVESTEHIVCPICSADFRTQDGRNSHLRQYHPKGQDLKCPGCHSRYTRAAGLMYHMENNLCHTVTREQFMKARMVNAIVHGAFGERDDARDETEKPDRLDLLSDQHFPALGESGHAPQTRNVEPTSYATGPSMAEQGSVRAPKQDLAEMSPEDVTKIQDLARRMLGGGMGLRHVKHEDGTPYEEIYLNPLSPFFQAERFRNRRGHFECPFEVCSVTCANPAMLEEHCRSSAHQQTIMTCPKCLKRFKSTSNFVSHLESSSVRCKIQRTAYYDDALAIATGGYVVCTGFHEDGSVRLKEEEPLYAKSLSISTGTPS